MRAARFASVSRVPIQGNWRCLRGQNSSKTSEINLSNHPQELFLQQICSEMILGCVLALGQLLDVFSLDLAEMFLVVWKHLKPTQFFVLDSFSATMPRNQSLGLSLLLACS